MISKPALIDKRVYILIFEYIPSIEYPTLQLVCKNAYAAIKALCLEKIVAKGSTKTYRIYFMPTMCRVQSNDDIRPL